VYAFIKNRNADELARELCKILLRQRESIRYLRIDKLSRVEKIDASGYCS